ncbi:hypothetical protein BH11PSE8_BH11PSE8_27970 [soil metagenome]
MSEPWSGDYRKLSIVPITAGSADAGYTASYKVNRTDAAGAPTMVHQAECEGRFGTEPDAREAAEEAARTFIDALLGAG